jgi:hypothetical protein
MGSKLLVSKGRIVRASDNKNIDSEHAWLDRSLPLADRFVDFVQYFERIRVQQQRVLQAMEPSFFEQIRNEGSISSMSAMAKDIEDGTFDARKLSLICDGLAYDLRESLQQTENGTLSLRIPAGVSYVDAIRTMSAYCSLRWPGIGQLFHDEGYSILKQVESVNGPEQFIEERELQIVPRIHSTVGLPWDRQIKVLAKEGLSPITLAEGVLLGTVFACKKPVSDANFNSVAIRIPATPYGDLGVRCADDCGKYLLASTSGYVIEPCHADSLVSVGAAGIIGDQFHHRRTLFAGATFSEYLDQAKTRVTIGGVIYLSVIFLLGTILIAIGLSALILGYLEILTDQAAIYLSFLTIVGILLLSSGFKFLRRSRPFQDSAGWFCSKIPRRNQCPLASFAGDTITKESCAVAAVGIPRLSACQFREESRFLRKRQNDLPSGLQLESNSLIAIGIDFCQDIIHPRKIVESMPLGHGIATREGVHHLSYYRGCERPE